MGYNKWWLGPIIFAALLLSISWSFLLFPKWIHEPDWIIYKRERYLHQLRQLLVWDKKERTRRRNRKKNFRRSQTSASQDIGSQFPSSAGRTNLAVTSNCRETSQCHQSEFYAIRHDAADTCPAIMTRDKAFSSPVSNSERGRTTTAEYISYSDDFMVTCISQSAEGQSNSSTATCKVMEKTSFKHYDMKTFASCKEINSPFFSTSQPSWPERKISGQRTSL